MENERDREDISSQLSQDVIVTWPSNSSFKPQIRQKQEAFVELKQQILKKDQLTIYPSDMTYNQDQGNLRKLLQDRSRHFPLGLCYISRSLVVLMNLPKKDPPEGQRSDVFYCPPKGPTMVLCAVEKKTPELNKYVLWLAQRTIQQIRTFTDEHFSAVYGLVDEEDLASEKNFEKRLSVIVKTTSALCSQKALYMYEEKCMNVTSAFIAAIAVNDLASAEEDGKIKSELSFLSSRQFCFFVENIDKDEVCVPQTSLEFTIEVARRLEKKGETLLALDDQQIEQLEPSYGQLKSRISHVATSTQVSALCHDGKLEKLKHVVASKLEESEIKHLRASSCQKQKLVVWRFSSDNEKEQETEQDLEGSLQCGDEDPDTWNDEVSDSDDIAAGSLSGSRNEDGYFSDSSCDMAPNSVNSATSDSTHCHDVKNRSIHEVQEETRHTVSSHMISTVKKCLKDHSVASIIGRPGEGKSTLAYQVLSELDGEGWGVYICKTPAEFHRIEKRGKIVVYINDGFGTTNFDAAKYRQWYSVLRKFQKNMYEASDQSSAVVAIFTCRNDVFSEMLEHSNTFAKTLFNSNSVIDVTHCKVLDDPEKEKLLPPDEFLEEKCQQMSPLRCTLETSSLWKTQSLDLDGGLDTEEAVTLFFRRLVTMPEYENVFKIIIHQGFLPLLQDLNKDSVLNTNAGLVPNRSRQIADAVKKMTNTVLRQSECGYIFLNTLISDCIVKIFASEDPNWLVQFCSLDILRWVIIEQPDQLPAESTCAIRIDSSLAKLVGDRLIGELKKGHLRFVLAHSLMTDTNFCNQFLTFLEEEDAFVLKDAETGDKLLHLLPVARVKRLNQYVLQRATRSTDILKCLKTCCECNNVELLEAMTNKHNDLLKRNISVVSRHWRVCARQGHTEVSAVLLQYVDVNSSGSSGNTALHYAASSGNVRLIKMLVSSPKVNLNLKNKAGETAIVRALYSNHEDVADVLFKKGANTKLRHGHGRTCFMIAAAVGSVDFLERLFDARTGQIEEHDTDGNTALHLAAMRGSKPAVEFLIHKGADVYSVNNAKQTPLHFVARHGRHLLVDLLSKSDYHLTQEKSRGKGAQPDNLKPTQSALQRGWTRTWSMVPVIGYVLGQTSPVETKYRRSTSFEEKDIHGMTPLHLAIVWNNHVVVGRLLQHKQNVDEVTATGQTGLHIASQAGNLQVIKALVNNEADANLRDDEGKTALHYAVAGGHLKVVKILLFKGNADPEIKDNLGGTALDLATRSKDKQVIKELKRAIVQNRDIKTIELEKSFNSRSHEDGLYSSVHHLKKNLWNLLVICLGVLVFFSFEAYRNN